MTAYRLPTATSSILHQTKLHLHFKPIVYLTKYSEKKKKKRCHIGIPYSNFRSSKPLCDQTWYILIGWVAYHDKDPIPTKCCIPLSTRTTIYMLIHKWSNDRIWMKKFTNDISHHQHISLYYVLFHFWFKNAFLDTCPSSSIHRPCWIVSAGTWHSKALSASNRLQCLRHE